MEIRVEKRGPVAVVSIDGSVDGMTAGDLVAALRQQVTAGTVQLVADLAGFPGETLFAYTDGVTDSKDQSGRFFSEERLLDLVSKGAPSAKALLDAVDSEVASHSAGPERSDDITMLAVRRAAAPLR